MTTTKTPATSQISTFCAQHRPATINYLMKSFQSISGVMTDVPTGAPLDGTVTATTISSGHLWQAVPTDPSAGDFHRVLPPGSYTIRCDAPGYPSVTIPGLVVTADTTTVADCRMNRTVLALTGSSFTDACSGTGSGGDGILDPGEEATVRVTLSNSGTVAATGVTASMTTAAAGITIVRGSDGFPDVAAGGSSLSNAPHFLVRVDPSVACGTAIPLQLAVAATQGSWTGTVNLVVGRTAGSPPTCTSHPCVSSVNPKEASPAGAPMRATKSGSLVGIAYTPACGATDHAVYWGSGPIAGSPVWSGSACALGVSGSAGFDPGKLGSGGWVYFTVVGQTATAEGSYGKDGAGSELPEAVGIGACDRPQALSGSCP